jgi:Protein of unknown function (DUF3592)
MESDDLEVDTLRPSTLRLWRHAAAIARIALGVLAVLWVGLSVADIVHSHRATRWPVTTGSVEWAGHAEGIAIITRYSRAVSMPRRSVPQLKYRYVVGRDTVFGWRENITQPPLDGFRVRPRAWFGEVLLPRDPRTGGSVERGAVVPVHFNPDDPADSALSVDIVFATWVELAGGIALFVVLARRMSARSPR